MLAKGYGRENHQITRGGKWKEWKERINYVKLIMLYQGVTSKGM